jgi:hypothetical protein
MRAKASAERSGAAVAAPAVAVLAVLAAGCGHWLWHHQPAAAAAPVHELDIGGANASEAFPQYWKRNTLVVDLSAVSGSGSITLKPVAGTAWPVRLALRITPGSIGELDVRGAHRLILPVAPSSGAPVDLELTPGVYTTSTSELTVQWGPAGPPQT